MSVVFTLNAGAAENPDTVSVATSSSAPDDPAATPSSGGPDDPAATPSSGAPDDPAATPSSSALPDAGPDGEAPPPRLPWGGTPTELTRAEPGANSAEVAAEGADVAPADTSGDTEADPEFAPKGQSTRSGVVKKSTTDVVPPKPPAFREPVSGGGSQVNYFYSVGTQNVSIGGLLFSGTYANFTIAKPELAAGDFHTLAEMSVQSLDGAHIAEVGWNVDRTVNGDSDPHLFVYHWVNHQESCYNACGFVQYSQNIKPGDTLPQGVTKQLGIQHYNGAWWVAYDTEWVGYFPDSLWGGQFTVTGTVQYFGEVASPNAQPCTDMGNGLPASNASAARIGSVSFLSLLDVNLSTYAVPSVYTVAQLSNRTFRYGGPGAC
ncbi:neprosin family prolyl endopeptidase [Krasilnikovia sp. MM14-A1004]|uniref:neprosin family prolyl endopeptidase n=1 Tax=Krasilnikovia sp. MM14-A1004 TaxID=3373541 RepID=UPI00399D546A